MKILFFGAGGSSKDICTVEMQMLEYLTKDNEVIACIGQESYCDSLNQLPNLTIEKTPDLKQGELGNKEIASISAHDYDVVFASSTPYVGFANYFAHKKGVKSVVQVLDIPLWRLGVKSWGEKWNWLLNSLKSTDIIIANTKITKDILINLGFSQKKIKVVYIGANHRTAKKASESESDSSICCVSRCVFHRTLDLGLYAFAMAKINNQLKMIGEGGELPRLVQMVYMIRTNAVFLGFVSETRKFLEIKKSLFGILPSICPTIGSLFPLESLVCGKPCIVWDTPINRDTYRGYVEYAPLCDLKAFTDKIEFLVSNSDYREERGEIGRNWVLKNRTYELWAKKLMEICKQ